MTPDFLVIGAMKAGTTTLYYDLATHPDIFLPILKEPELLVRDLDLDQIRDEYAALFRSARPDQLKGEASTAYTKRPTHDGAAAKARALCGPNLKLIYMRRDPIERMLSQYQHERQRGTIACGFAEAIRRYPRLLDYSRYDWQIAPWIEAFGPASLLQLELDDYAARRVETVQRVVRFIGADPARLPPIKLDLISNRADDPKTIRNPLLRSLIYSSFYQRAVRGFIPTHLRERLRRTLLPAPEAAPVELDPDTLHFVREQLSQPGPGLDRSQPSPLPQPSAGNSTR
ncbi:MAG TPA: sulfotransferase [Allosphingosinicella sp.]|nr:sulfotransferase [Allosphingosinicella sp.]